MTEDNPSKLEGSSPEAQIQRALTAELFGPLGAALPAYAAAITIATAGVFIEGRIRDFVCLLGIVAVSATRIFVLRVYRSRPDLRETSRHMRRWGLIYGWLAGLWTLLLGIDASFMMLSGSTVLQLCGTTMAIGMTGGIAARHAPHPWIVVVQMIGILVPYTIGVTWRYGVGAAGLLIMTLCMFLGVWSATRQINSNLKLAMRSNIANQTLKESFDTALNNMTHGLLMFDIGQFLQIANQRFAQMFQVDRNDLRPGMSLSEVIDICMSSYSRTTRTRAEYIAMFEGALSARDRLDTTLDLIDGRRLAFRFEPVKNYGTVLMVEDVTEKHKAATQIARLAHYDSLTGLPNRSSLTDMLPRLVEERTLGEPIFSLLYLDLDGFKEVNDTLGHATGDSLLVEVAARLTKNIRRSDLCFRIGGDEFVLVQYMTDGDDESIAKRLIDQISLPFTIEGHEINISLSVGIARYGEDGAVGEELLKNADIALYKAKEEGKRTFRRFLPTMAAEAMDRRIREADLRHAIENEAIDIHFQPIVNVISRRIVSCEALLRWNHPTRGIMPAGETIKLAESSGLIVDLGGIVLRKACQEASKWNKEIRVAVNLSAAQFKERIVVDQIGRALAASGLDGNRLEVEMTESLVFSNLAAVRGIIEEIRLLGVRIAIDDFGTGYSSLSYLNQIPFDTVKIDRSFVLRLGTDKMAAALVQLMGGLLQSIGKSMVVEGVETHEQLSILRNLGADFMQGYFFSKAMPAGEIAAWLGSKPFSRLKAVA